MLRWPRQAFFVPPCFFQVSCDSDRLLIQLTFVFRCWGAKLQQLSKAQQIKNKSNTTKIKTFYKQKTQSLPYVIFDTLHFKCPLLYVQNGHTFHAHHTSRQHICDEYVTGHPILTAMICPTKLNARNLMDHINLEPPPAPWASRVIRRGGGRRRTKIKGSEL